MGFGWVGLSWGWVFFVYIFIHITNFDLFVLLPISILIDYITILICVFKHIYLTSIYNKTSIIIYINISWLHESHQRGHIMQVQLAARYCVLVTRHFLHNLSLAFVSCCVVGFFKWVYGRCLYIYMYSISWESFLFIYIVTL